MLNPVRVDAAVDLTYGALIALSIVLIMQVGTNVGIAFGVGVFASYVVHVVWKMARFDPDWMTRAVQESVEESVGETVEEQVGETVEESVSETVEEKVGETVEKSVEESVGETVEKSVDETVEKTVGETVEEKVGETVEKTVGETVEKSVDETVEKTVGETVEEAVERTVGERLDEMQAEVEAIDERIDRRPREDEIEELIDGTTEEGQTDRSEDN
ncbi:hypothetical protein [Halomontanus rarus]|uniref:hypothetical protein n=1 Tax=Halomontanus rarus TaxID=3034020 RepID=UPI0023E8E1DC|nr:hypothetical protein [Halovivax sp. TS33]